LVGVVARGGYAELINGIQRRTHRSLKYCPANLIIIVQGFMLDTPARGVWPKSCDHIARDDHRTDTEYLCAPRVRLAHLCSTISPTH
jgi:hypothetical protein